MALVIGLLGRDCALQLAACEEIDVPRDVDPYIAGSKGH